MIPFPGESVLIEDAADITAGTDFSLYSDIVFRKRSRTLAAGSEWRAFAYSADMDYAEETGLDATVQWAVEVLSGTVTVTAREGLDPTYSAYTAPLGTSLGSHTVTGPATLLIDSTFTADQVADLGGTIDAAFILGLTATSGSAVVQQIKLRVWPTGGAHGGFVTQDAFDTDPTTALVRVVADEANRSGSATATGTEASWDGAAAGVVADATAGPYAFQTVTAGGSGPHAEGIAQFAGSQTNLDGTNILTNISLTPLVAMVQGVDWSAQTPLGPGAPFGEFIRPPQEVRDEDAHNLYPQVGTGSVAWLNAGLVIEQTGQPAAVVPALTLATHSDDAPTITGSGSVITVAVEVDHAGAALGAPTAGGTVTSSHALPTDARYLFAHVSHTGALTAAEWPGTFPGSPTDPAVVTGIDAVIHFGTGDPTGTFSPIKSYAHMPAYRVWLPTVARVIPLRQFHRDDGLGVTPPRAFGGASRIRTGRAYGYD